jgi:hypothetical protein
LRPVFPPVEPRPIVSGCGGGVTHRRSEIARGVVSETYPEVSTLSLGASLFLLAVGAILTFAVEVEASGFNINTVGIILMVVGAIGLLLSLVWMQRGRTASTRTVVREEEPRDGRVVREERRDVL